VINLFAGKALDSSHPQEFAFFLQHHNKENPPLYPRIFVDFLSRIIFFLHWKHSIGASHWIGLLKLNCVSDSCNPKLTGFATRASFRRFSKKKNSGNKYKPAWVSGNFKGNTKQAVGRWRFGKASVWKALLHYRTERTCDGLGRTDNLSFYLSSVFYVSISESTYINNYQIYFSFLFSTGFFYWDELYNILR